MRAQRWPTDGLALRRPRPNTLLNRGALRHT